MYIDSADVAKIEVSIFLYLAETGSVAGGKTDFSEIVRDQGLHGEAAAVDPRLAGPSSNLSIPIFIALQSTSRRNHPGKA